MITITVDGKFVNQPQKEAMARAIYNSLRLQGMNASIGDGFQAEQMSSNKLHGALRTMKTSQLRIIVEVKT